MDMALHTIEELRLLLTGTFGPNGVSALIQEPSGTMVITRSGYRILQSASKENQTPIYKSILQSARNVYDTLGDGVKSFIFVVADLLNNFYTFKRSISRTDAVFKLHKLLMALSNTFVTSEGNSTFLYDTSYFKKANSALFYTSCPVPVSRVLHDVFNKWIDLSLRSITSENIHESVTSLLRHLSHNFSVLCCRNYFGCRSVSSSHVLNGFLIDKIALNLPKDKSKIVKMIFYKPEQSLGESDTEFEVNKLISEHSDMKEYPLMLVTSAVLSDLVLFLLRQKQVIVLYGISVSVVDYIFSLIHQGSNDVIEVKYNIIGAKECTWIGLQTVYQLILSGPTDALVCEYASICHNALKLMLTVCRGTSSLVRAGGDFERMLHFHLVAKESKFHFDPFSCGIDSRKNLLKWHYKKELLKYKSNNSNKMYISNSSVENTNNAIGKLNSQTLHRYNENVLNEQHSLNVNDVCEALENHESTQSNAERSRENSQVLSDWSNDLILSNIIAVFETLDKNVLELILPSLLTIPKQVGSKNISDNVYEPISFKIELLQQIIYAFLKLLKFETV